MLFGKGPAQDRETFRALAEEAEPDGKGVSIQGPNRRCVRGNAGPVGGGDVLAHRKIIAGGCLQALEQPRIPGAQHSLEPTAVRSPATGMRSRKSVGAILRREFAPRDLMI